jgi:hypothetical protein
MQNNRNVVTSLKLFLVSSALTGTVWLWSLFANRTVLDLNKKKQATNNTDNQPPQVVVPVTQQDSTQAATSTASVSPTPTLRVVNLPGGVDPTNAQPVVVYSAPNPSSGSASSASSGSSSSSNPAPAPVTSTGSSQP